MRIVETPPPPPLPVTKRTIPRPQRRETLRSVYDASSIKTRSFDVTDEQLLNENSNVRNLAAEISNTFNVQVVLSHRGHIIGTFLPKVK